MDPLGVTFERYDFGRYQRRDAGQPVDATGWIDRTGVKELDGKRVNGPAELMAVLARSGTLSKSSSGTPSAISWAATKRSATQTPAGRARRLSE